MENITDTSTSGGLTSCVHHVIQPQTQLYPVSIHANKQELFSSLQMATMFNHNIFKHTRFMFGSYETDY